jgi:hypothetical protein
MYTDIRSCAFVGLDNKLYKMHSTHFKNFLLVYLTLARKK